MLYSVSNLLFYHIFIRLLLIKKLLFVIWISKNRSKLNRIKLDQIGFLKLTIQNRTEPHIILSLDRMSFCLKTDLNRIANTLNHLSHL